MIDFGRPEFLWALPLTLVPVIIHLLNRLRYQRIRFPTTQFLLESQRRYKIRVILQDWIILFLRMLVVAVIILMFAEPKAGSGGVGRYLARQATHYIFVIDDSLSMQSQLSPVEGRPPWDVAKKMAKDLLRVLGENNFGAKVTLFRLSRIEEMAEPRVDADAVEITPESIEALLQIVDGWECSFARVPVIKGVDFGLRRAEGSSQHPTIVVFSDLQRIDWQASPSWEEIRDRLRQASARLRLIPCGARVVVPNLSLSQLEPAGGIVAVGVPVPVRLRVDNFSEQPVRNVVVEPYCNGESLPPVVIPEIEPFSSAVHDFYVMPRQAGDNRIEVRLGADSLEGDNVRYLVLPVKEAVSVLIVDGDPLGNDAQFLELALSPGGVTTGIRCRRIYSEALSPDLLHEHDLVVLVNVGRLAPQLVDELERYVSQGGGLLYFVGERTEPAAFAEQFARQGKGIFPVELSPVRERAPSVFLPSANLVFVEHSGLASLRGLTGSVTEPIFVTRYLSPQLPATQGEKADGASFSPTGQIFLALDDGTPLGITFTFGQGKCALIGTTAGPRWNNWARVSPSFVVTMIELVSFLARRHLPLGMSLVGHPVELHFQGAAPVQLHYRLAGSDMEGKLLVDTANALPVRLPPAVQPGFGTVWWELEPFERVERWVAANIDPRESDLRPTLRGEIAALLDGVDLSFVEPEGLAQSGWESQVVDLVPFLLTVVAILLVSEALAAGWAQQSRSARRKGTPAKILGRPRRRIFT